MADESELNNNAADNNADGGANNDGKGGDNGGANGADNQDDPEFVDDGKGPEDITPPKENDDDDGKGGDDGDVDPEQKANIQREARKIAQREMAPIIEQTERMRVKSEWSDVKAQYPELGKLETKILRYANHKNYQGKPIMQAIMDAAGPNVFLRIGALRSKAADAEANASKGGGSASRTQTPANTGTVPSFKGKTAAEIQKIRVDFAKGVYSQPK